MVGEEPGVGGWEVEREIGGPEVAAERGRNGLFAMKDELAEDVVIL